ncbi:MAG TPA: polyprenyl synthetase family protein [Anaerolineales bacterium]
MSLESLMQTYIPAVETELRQVVAHAGGPNLEGLHHMLAYHMGWESEGAGPVTRGKRIRPLMILLCTAAAGGEWERALPAAAAVELVHNFSLIHDDIEDNSPLRHGRPTIWSLWGVAQATNAGDAMFTLAQLALLRLEETASPQVAIEASRLLQETCLQLTQGQYLDLSYEQRGDLTLEAYWPMVSGKTAALLSASTGLGALVAGAEAPAQAAYRQFGRSLGLAFQAQDDLLGIWGDAALTGKSSESDLVSGKKSLPVLYGLSLGKSFAARWNQGPVQAEDVSSLAAQLEQEGALSYTQEIAGRLTQEALDALQTARPQGPAGEALHELALFLLKRQG